MGTTNPKPVATTVAHVGAEIPFGSNDVRLPFRQWLVATLVLSGCFTLIPRVWTKVERLEAGPDYRVPYALGNDYWNYARTCREVAVGERTLLVGDSVIWGHYVASEETLSHHLNQRTGETRFANLGLDGVHPAALCGLVEHYGQAIRGRNVMLNCNLLWISSARHDLSTDKEFAFNHPALVPQFWPKIPCYRAPLSDKLGTVVARHFSFLGWADHVRTVYFGGSDLAAWTLEHPYRNPLAQVTLQLPSPDELPSPEPDARPWHVKGIETYRPEWVALDDSLQWQFFRRTVAVLRERGNRVFVLVGPFNEHMLADSALRAYHERQEQVAAWLDQERIPYCLPPALPSDLYADASHPTADGYQLLAQWLLEEDSFRPFHAKK